MTLQRGILMIATAGTLALVISAPAEARRFSDEDVCPTGQHKNVLTAICEGPTSGFTFVSPSLGYWDGGYGYYRGWHHHMRRRHHHHHH